MVLLVCVRRDNSNVIGQLTEHAEDTLSLQLAWMSWIADHTTPAGEVTLRNERFRTVKHLRLT